MSLAELLGDHRELLEAVAAAVDAEAPGFNDGLTDTSHPLRRARSRVMGRTLHGIVWVLDDVDRRSADDFDWGDHVELGRLEAAAGRALGPLLRVPWIASRLVLQRAAEEARRHGRNAADLARLSETIVAWSDRISTEFSAGYAAESVDRAVATEQARAAQLRKLIAGELRPADLAADERLGGRVRVLVARGEDRRRLGQMEGVLLAADLDLELVAIVEATSAAVDLAAGVFPDAHQPRCRAALGVAVDPMDVPMSFRSATRALDRGVSTSSCAWPIVDCDETIGDLVLLADAQLARTMAARITEPLHGDRTLIATLSAWLNHDTRPKAAARALGVHPHTVTYRMAHIRTALGPLLDDPGQRWLLHLALRLDALHTAADRSVSDRNDPVGRSDDHRSAAHR